MAGDVSRSLHCLSIVLKGPLCGSHGRRLDSVTIDPGLRERSVKLEPAKFYANHCSTEYSLFQFLAQPATCFSRYTELISPGAHKPDFLRVSSGHTVAVCCGLIDKVLRMQMQPSVFRPFVSYL